MCERSITTAINSVEIFIANKDPAQVQIECNFATSDLISAVSKLSNCVEPGKNHDFDGNNQEKKLLQSLELFKQEVENPKESIPIPDPQKLNMVPAAAWAPGAAARPPGT